MREKGGNFKMSLLSNIVRLFLNCLGSTNGLQLWSFTNCLVVVVQIQVQVKVQVQYFLEL